MKFHRGISLLIDSCQRYAVTVEGKATKELRVVWDSRPWSAFFKQWFLTTRHLRNLWFRDIQGPGKLPLDLVVEIDICALSCFQFSIGSEFFITTDLFVLLERCNASLKFLWAPFLVQQSITGAKSRIQLGEFCLDPRKNNLPERSYRHMISWMALPESSSQVCPVQLNEIILTTYVLLSKHSCIYYYYYYY